MLAKEKKQLQEQLKLAEDNLAVIKEEFGAEAKIFEIGKSIVETLESRVEKGGKLSTEEIKQLNSAMAQVNVFEELLISTSFAVP